VAETFKRRMERNQSMEVKEGTVVWELDFYQTSPGRLLSGSSYLKVRNITITAIELNVFQQEMFERLLYQYSMLTGRTVSFDMSLDGARACIQVRGNPRRRCSLRDQWKSRFTKQYFPYFGPPARSQGHCGKDGFPSRQPEDKCWPSATMLRDS
jgi:hypothetical protein